MKRMLKTTLLTGIILFSLNTLSQTKSPGHDKPAEDQKATNMHFDILFNTVSTSLNYGDANGALADFKKEARGIQAGVSFQAGITPYFSVVSEFYFMMKGGKLKANNPMTGGDQTTRLYGLELPVLARLHLGKFHANAGPSIAYNLSGTRKINGESNHISFRSASDGFKRFDAGVQMGGGYTFRVKQKRVGLDLRYNYGLTNISRSQQLHNRGFNLSIHTSPRWRSN